MRNQHGGHPGLSMLRLVFLIAIVSLQTLTSASGTVSVGGCLAVGGLARAQRRLCARAPAAAAAALGGLRAAVAECRHQLRHHRWDCAPLAARASNPHQSAMLKRGFRESAFAYAITAAGVAHSVARACAQGHVLACGCDPGVRAGASGPRAPPGPPAPGAPKAARSWKWGGCSHNLDYGMGFSKQFLDARETGGDLQSRVNLHNNEAGRLAVSSNMEVRCKCHGMSGSCQLRTCWRAAPDMRLVGRQLKQKYRTAVLVDQSNLSSGTPRLAGRGGRRRGAHRKKKWRQVPGPGAALLHFERSPSFCERDASLEVAGTAGRRCARSRGRPGACGALCCGRGHDLQRARRSARCRCRFKWCCDVECDTCERDEWVAVCK